MKKNNKILIISNNSLSDNNSNGRTLSSFLRNIPKENIAQIYITSEMPQSKVCDNFYQITDNDVIHGMLGRKKIGRVLKEYKIQEIKNNDIPAKRIKKTIFKMIIRDVFWMTNVWYTKELKQWINEFSPDIILFFAGESCFTYRIVFKIANINNIPILTYNSEAYYFKERNYLKSGFLSDLIYPLFHHCFKKIYAKLIQKSNAVLYANIKLKNDYDREFQHNSYVLYTSSEVDFIKKNEIKNPPIISYLGNLGVGRHKALIQIAEALQNIDKSYKLDIYGKLPDDTVEKKLLSCKGINYCGVVSYDKVINIMHNSDLLVHGESFEEFTKWDLKYAFTTKIADILSCGTCFFVYAPEELACTEYLISNKCACVVSNEKDLMESLKRILSDKSLRDKYINKAKKVSELNHNTKRNCDKFELIVSEIIKNCDNKTDI